MAHTVLQKDHLILPPKGHIPRKKNNTHTHCAHPEFPKHGEQDNYSLCKAAKYITNVLELSFHILEVNLVPEHYHTRIAALSNPTELWR